jgi:hypothetical protein
MRKIIRIVLSLWYVTLSGNNAQNPPKYVNMASILRCLDMETGTNRILVVDDEPEINMLR